MTVKENTLLALHFRLHVYLGNGIVKKNGIEKIDLIPFS